MVNEGKTLQKTLMEGQKTQILNKKFYQILNVCVYLCVNKKVLKCYYKYRIHTYSYYKLFLITKSYRQFHCLFDIPQILVFISEQSSIINTGLDEV